jgi:hypothetical protein
MAAGASGTDSRDDAVVDQHFVALEQRFDALEERLKHLDIATCSSEALGTVEARQRAIEGRIQALEDMTGIPKCGIDAIVSPRAAILTGRFAQQWAIPTRWCRSATQLP